MINKTLQELSLNCNKSDTEINNLHELIKNQSILLKQLEETKEDLEINAIKDINVITKINDLKLKVYSENTNGGQGGDVDFYFKHYNYKLITLYTNQYVFIFTSSTNRKNTENLLNNIYTYLYIIDLETNKILTTNYIKLTITDTKGNTIFPFAVSSKDENTIVIFYVDNAIRVMYKAEITNDNILGIKTEFNSNFIDIIKNNLTEGYYNYTRDNVIKTDKNNRDIYENTGKGYYMKRIDENGTNNIPIYHVINNTNLAHVIYCKNNNTYYGSTDYTLTYAQKGLSTDLGNQDTSSNCIMYVFNENNKHFYLIGYQDIDQFSIETFNTNDLIYEAYSLKDSTFKNFNFLRFCRHDSNEIFLNPWDVKADDNKGDIIRGNIEYPVNIIGLTCSCDNIIYSFKFNMTDYEKKKADIKLINYETEEPKFEATITGYDNSILVYQTKNNISFVSLSGDLMVFNHIKGVWISCGKIKDKTDLGEFAIYSTRNNYGNSTLMFTHINDQFNNAYIISPMLPAIINEKPSQITYYKNELQK